MFKTKVIAAALVLTFAAALPVAADVITVDPDGTGIAGDQQVLSLDWNLGSAIGVDVTANSAPGTTFQLYYQTNLSVFNLSDGSSTFPNNGSTLGIASGEDSWTLVLGFAETLTGVSFDAATGNPVLNFSFADQTGFENFFQIYANDTVGDPLSGACFVCGTLIMEGTLNNVNGDFSSNFTVTSSEDNDDVFGNETIVSGGLLDQAGPDNYSGTQSVSGGGGVTISGTVVDYSEDYFPNAPSTITFVTSTSTTTLPFLQQNPSACFFALTSTGGLEPVCTPSPDNQTGVGPFVGVGSVGAVNGISGNNTMFQADANTSFDLELQEVPIPEPASLTLLGIGLAGVAAARRRKKAQQKK